MVKPGVKKDKVLFIGQVNNYYPTRRNTISQFNALGIPFDIIITERKYTYKEYLDILSPKEREIKLQSERHNTFLVFHSGKVIMSGLTADFMREIYYYFLSIIRTSFDKIEERLLPLEASDEEDKLSLDEELALLELQ